MIAEWMGYPDTAPILKGEFPPLGIFSQGQMMRLVLCLLTVFFGSGLITGAENRGVVHVRISDLTGHRLENELPQGNPIEFIGSGGKDYSDRFKGTTGEVPYGSYTLRVEFPGFRVYRRKVVVVQPSVMVHVGLVGGGVGGGQSYSEFSGSVNYLPKDREGVWVRLLPLLANNGVVIDSEVDDRGDFQFSGMTRGSYLLVVLRDVPEDVRTPRVLHSERVEVTRRRNKVVIALR